LSVPVNEKEVISLYNALQTQLESKSSPLQLSQNYINNLQLTFSDISLKKYLDLNHKSIDSPEINLPKLTQLIHVNAKTSRPKQAQQAFDSIEQLGMSPDLVAYNHLASAYSRIGDPSKVLQIIEKIKSKHLEPDLITYSILISAFIKTQNLNAAFEVYNKLKSKGLKPNQIVYSTLIKGCIVKKDFKRAWKTFDHFREFEKPDGIAYSIMIRCCSLTKDAERALDLFEEMSTLNIAVNQDTFNSMIKACGSRPDYYNDAFNLMEQMLENGFRLNTESFLILFEIMAENRDLKRMRLLWNDFATRIDFNIIDKEKVYETPPLLMKPFMISNVFKLYKNVLVDGVQKGERKSIGIMPEVIKQDINGAIEPIMETQLPINEHVGLSKDAISREADWMWELTEKLANEGKLQMNGILLNRRLEQLCAVRGKNSIQNAYDFLRVKFSQYGINPNGSSYLYLLKVSWKKGVNPLGQKIWQEFRKFDDDLELKLQKQCEITPMTISEKEVARFESARTARAVSEAFLIVAKGYNKQGDLKSAIDTLEETRDFRYPYYILPIPTTYVRNIMSNAVREYDNGNLEPLTRLEKILQKPNPNPLEKVQRELKSKHISGSWWGWEAMGVKGSEKEMIMRKQRKESAKVIQREMELRKKGDVSFGNREKKIKLFKPVI
jgi:pentatricopeptide repeat protein